MTTPSRPALTLAEVAALVRGQLRGDGGVVIAGVNTIRDAGDRELTWTVGEPHTRKLATSRAAAVIGPTDLPATPMPAVLVSDVEAAIATVLERFLPDRWAPSLGVHATALVDSTAQLGGGVAIGPYVVIGPRSVIGSGTVIHAGAFIGADCEIGEQSTLWPNVFIADRCRLGRRNIVWSNAVIGRDGFGFIAREGRHRRIPQIGTVVLEDDVEVGACSCIDRAKCGETRIGAGSKIDNLVQIAHNVRTGRGCILVGQAGVAGSVHLGHGVVLGGQVGVTDGVEIGDGTMLTAQSGVTRSLSSHLVAEGKPAQERHRALREQAAARRLPELLDEIRELSKRVRRLEIATDHSASD